MILGGMASGVTEVEGLLEGDDVLATGRAVEAFGAKVEQPTPASWRIEPTGYTASDFHIEPDASAATYLWGAEVLTKGQIDIGTPSDAFTQPDAKAYDVIAQFPNMPAVIDGSQMQDAIPTIAVLAAFNETPVRFVGIENLRVKECDRIRAVSTGLNNIREGLAKEEGDDLLVASDPSLAGQSLPAEIDTFADHRIAMSFSLAGLKIRDITILDPACVGKTYPGYWDALASLGVDLVSRGDADPVGDHGVPGPRGLQPPPGLRPVPQANFIEMNWRSLVWRYERQTGLNRKLYP